MTTRSIVTSQPDVACDVCARRLLRGEQPDVFIAAGRRLTVCELCAPRAAHEGWKRESDTREVTLPPMRPRRGRSLLARLRGLAGPAGERALVPDVALAPEAEEQPAQPFDLYGNGVGDGGAGAAGEAAATGEQDDVEQTPALNGHAPAPAGDHLHVAVEVFNGSEYPRRVAGLARSLGTPLVTVREAEHLASIVDIVVAWELCWYRYAVDLGEERPLTVATGQGNELHELRHEEREGNASADESGALTLAQ
jgi:hypothetical protein